MRLHVVDGTYELYRAHFSKRPDHFAPDGRTNKATVGIAASLAALLADPAEQVTHLAVAFDNPIRSFRNDLFAGYKTDDGVPPELHAQFDPAEAAVRALGVTVWSMNRFEADDALATAAARWRGEVEQVRILTPDKDLGQCLDGRRVVQVDRVRQREIDEAALRERWGVGPRSIPDLLALSGDEADGVPGLHGFGVKSAGALLAAFERIEAIPDDAARWPAAIRRREALAETLAASRADALLYRTLTTLATDVPLAESLDDLAWRGAPRAAWEAWCEEVGSADLRTRPPRWLPSR